MREVTRRGLLLAACFGVCVSAVAEERGTKWPSKSMERPRPVVVTPAAITNPGGAPSDAVVLFDGTNLNAWEMVQKWKKDKNPRPVVTPTWKVASGYMEAIEQSGDLRTKRAFGDCQIHIEWATPSEVKGDGQGRGNSGIMLGGLCEVQVLDSYENDTYPDGQAGAIYAKYPPLVNASRKPGEWQTYDIIFHAYREGRPAMLTVIHNGVVIHHGVDPRSRTQEITIGLQDHKNPVRYRNIWVRALAGYPE